jgi:predicted nucleotidyltransferase
MLHGFYHPDFSDLDFTVYGRRNTETLRETLRDMYGASKQNLVNEFDECMKWAKGRHWNFRKICIEEFCQCCRRKMIYAIYRPEKASRDFKVEFEPVRDWSEICEQYDSDSRIRPIGWTRLIAEVLEDSDSFFIPSIYPIEVKKILSGLNAGPIERITSYVEEFRGQAEAGEKILVEGNLEKVTDSKGERYQITLTRAPNYYEQVLKPASSSDTW